MSYLQYYDNFSTFFLHIFRFANISLHPRRRAILRKKYFRKQVFKYKKITKNILTVEKKFHNFSTKNDQHFLGANLFGTDTIL